jgi:hypothetical protein
MLKIIIIIIGYILNNFTTHITILLYMMEKGIISKSKNEIHFLKKKIIRFVNVETVPWPW